VFRPPPGTLWPLSKGARFDVEVDMTPCWWSGTNYTFFRADYEECGGSLRFPHAILPTVPSRSLSAPSRPPHNVPRRAVWRILSSEASAIFGQILPLLVFTFTAVSLRARHAGDSATRERWPSKARKGTCP
jgi:hypothetical protein